MFGRKDLEVGESPPVEVNRLFSVCREPEVGNNPLQDLLLSTAPGQPGTHRQLFTTDMAQVKNTWRVFTHHNWGK